MPQILLVFLGGGLGAIARYGVSIGLGRLTGAGFPWPTLLVNVAGSFAMGLVVAWFALRGEGGQDMRLFLTTGVLGGFTTFSAFSLETMLLYERGAVGFALAYVLASVILSVLALAVAMALVRAAG